MQGTSIAVLHSSAKKAKACCHPQGSLSVKPLGKLVPLRKLQTLRCPKASDVERGVIHRNADEDPHQCPDRSKQAGKQASKQASKRTYIHTYMHTYIHAGMHACMHPSLRPFITSMHKYTRRPRSPKNRTKTIDQVKARSPLQALITVL